MNAEVSIDVDYIDQIPAKTSLKLIEAAQQAQKNIKAFKEAIRARSALFRRLEELDIDVGFSPENAYIHVRFTGDGDRLGQVWGAFRQSGWKTTCRPEKGKNEFYAFWHQEGLVDLFMNFTSSVCRRVQVGTKMVEQPIYEMHCGELPELEADTPKPNLTVVEGGTDDIPF